MTAFSIAPSEPVVIPDPAAPEAVSALAFALERPQDGPAVDDLIDRAFGPGRYAKTAERLREGGLLLRGMSICAWEGERLVGAVRQWRVLIGETSAVFLGPFAVAHDWRNRGLGRSLIRRAGVLADAAGERLTLLVGDQAYFVPLGYEPVPPGRAALPGPVDPRRVLWRAGAEAAFEGVSGAVRIPPER